MAVLISNSGITGAYTNYASASAMYLGSVLVWSAGTPGPAPTPPSPTPSEDYTLCQGAGVWSSGITCHIVTGVHAEMDFEAQLRTTLQPSTYYAKGTNAPVTAHTGTFFSNTPSQSATQLTIGYKMVENIPGLCTYVPELVWTKGKVSGGIYGQCKLSVSEVPYGQVMNFKFKKDGVYDSHDMPINTNGYTAQSIGPEPLWFGLELAPISRLRFWNNGLLIFDGRAAIRNSDGQGGLYDSVSETFYTDENVQIVEVQ